MTLAGKTALVTGGSRGIGRAITLKLAREGADIVINYFRNRQPAEETAREVRELGREVRVIKANVGEPEKIEAMTAELETAKIGIDILVSNAASGFIRPSMEQDARSWDWTLNINARALLLLAKALAPGMRDRGGGCIVGISSLGAQRVLPNYVTVGVSKAALEAVVRYLAVELSAYNIRVNAVSGSLVETEALRFFANRETLLSMARERTPAGRMVTPEDIANAVHFLCLPQSEMIRGQAIVVDGGLSLLALA